jgi:hypothetical protein
MPLRRYPPAMRFRLIRVNPAIAPRRPPVVRASLPGFPWHSSHVLGNKSDIRADKGTGSPHDSLARTATYNNAERPAHDPWRTRWREGPSWTASSAARAVTGIFFRG